MYTALQNIRLLIPNWHTYYFLYNKRLWMQIHLQNVLPDVTLLISNLFFPTDCFFGRTAKRWEIKSPPRQRVFSKYLLVEQQHQAFIPTKNRGLFKPLDVEKIPSIRTRSNKHFYLTSNSSSRKFKWTGSCQS